MKKILNILLGVLLAITVVLTVYAVATGGAEAAIGVNLVWGYFLVVFAVISALLCAVFGMIKNPAGIRGTILSVGLIIVIVGVSYFYANSHTIEIPNLSSGGFFGGGETVLTEASILVTYIAMVAAFITAVATEIWGAFK